MKFSRRHASQAPDHGASDPGAGCGCRCRIAGRVGVAVAGCWSAWVVLRAETARGVGGGVAAHPGGLQVRARLHAAPQRQHQQRKAGTQQDGPQPGGLGRCGGSDRRGVGHSRPGGCRTRLLLDGLGHCMELLGRLGELQVRIDFACGPDRLQRFGVLAFAGQHLGQFVLRAGAAGLFGDDFAQHALGLRQLTVGHGLFDVVGGRQRQTDAGPQGGQQQGQ